MGVKKKQDLPGWGNEKILADKVNDTVGSGKFIAIQTGFLIFYILFQCFAPDKWAFDKYPFILLNLLLSFQAGYTGPFIVWAQNRAAERDRRVMAFIRDMVNDIRHVLDSLLRVEKKIDKDIIDLKAQVASLEDQNNKLLLLISDIHREVTVKGGE